MRERAIYLAATGVAASGVVIGFATDRWVAAAVILMTAAGVALAGFLEHGPDSAKEVSVIASLSALAVAGRLLVHPFPSVQPMTVLIVATGAAFGVRVGVAVGALAALVSNFFLLQGPWTIWQMLLWAGCGAAGGLLRGAIRHRVAFGVACCLIALAFSLGTDVFSWFYSLAHTPAGLVTLLTIGLPYTIAHAGASLVIGLAVGPELRRMLDRFARRMHTDVAWEESWDESWDELPLPVR